MSLRYHLKGLMGHNKDGSFATQRARSAVLLQCADQLKDRGYRLERPHQFKQKHIDYLVDRWKKEELSPGTIKNRVAHLRWLSEKIEKPTIVKSNTDLGIDKREFATQRDKSIVLDNRLDKIASERIRDALRLQEAFGLRREEALKFKPELACKTTTEIQLQASWCKGGRERTIPILDDSQRSLLAEIKAKYPTGSLIPKEATYKEFVKKYENSVAASGLGKGHGLRHGYAQKRYLELTGNECSVQGGLQRNAMSNEQKQIDLAARLTISAELGHGRVDIVAKYIGN
jgi:hypothetical protein